MLNFSNSWIFCWDHSNHKSSIWFHWHVLPLLGWLQKLFWRYINLLLPLMTASQLWYIYFPVSWGNLIKTSATLDFGFQLFWSPLVQNTSFSRLLTWGPFSSEKVSHFEFQFLWCPPVRKTSFSGSRRGGTFNKNLTNLGFNSSGACLSGKQFSQFDFQIFWSAPVRKCFAGFRSVQTFSKMTTTLSRNFLGPACPILKIQ